MAAMRSIQVSARGSAPDAAAARPKLSPAAHALLAALPALPPFTGGHDMTHLDPLLQHTQLCAPSAVAAVSAAAAVPSIPASAVHLFSSSSEHASAASSHAAASSLNAMVAPLSPSSQQIQQAQLQGYDFTFVQPPDQDLLCVICSLVCRDAVETSCSHIFCASCLTRWLQQKSECVTCRAPLSLASRTDVHPSGFLRRKILGLAVACIHSSSSNPGLGGGCEWKGELRYMSSHLRREWGLAKLLHAAHSFIYAKPEHSASAANGAAGGDVANGAVTLESVELAVRQAFPPDLLESLSLGALFRLVSTLPAVHWPSSANEALSHSGLGHSLVLRRHWASSGTLPPPVKCVEGMGGAAPGESFSLSGTEAHRCDGERCIFPPDESALPASVDEDVHIASAALRSRALRLMSSARLQFLVVSLAVRAYFSSLPVRVLLAFLQSKGAGSAASSRLQGLEKSELVDEAMRCRMEPDREDPDAPQKWGAYAPGAGLGLGSHGGGGVQPAANLLRGGHAFAQALNSEMQAQQRREDASAAARLLMQLHSMQLGQLGGGASSGGGSPLNSHHNMHAAAHAHHSHVHHGAAQGSLSVQPFGTHGLMLSLHMPAASPPVSSASASAAAGGGGSGSSGGSSSSAWNPARHASIGMDLESEIQRQRLERERHERLRRIDPYADTWAEAGADDPVDQAHPPPPSRRDPSNIFLAQALMLHAQQHRLAAEARLAELEEAEHAAEQERRREMEAERAVEAHLARVEQMSRLPSYPGGYPQTRSAAPVRAAPQALASAPAPLSALAPAPAVAPASPPVATIAASPLPSAAATSAVAAPATATTSPERLFTPRSMQNGAAAAVVADAPSSAAARSPRSESPPPAKAACCAVQ